MNHTYRLVWSQLSNTWIAVAENAKGKGKSVAARKLLAAALVAAGVLPVSSTYAANAADATVTLGNGSINTVGTTTTIKQNSQNLAIDWTGLSTAANEALIFNQPNSSAIALNRITGSSPSTLLGSLTANGQVFILNPNGVLFGAGSQVNVGGLVASTLGMSNADLAAGRMVFALDGNANGSVVNKGAINAADGGYVALIAGTVRNEGEINAKLGTALLAAGNKVTLNINNGSLLGYSIDQGAVNALAENKQLIQANGGQVLMSAKALNNLTTAVVNNTGLIEAKTIENRSGRIMLMSDMEVGTVNVAGKLDASAPTTGDGGFIETSAAHVKVANETIITTKSASGLSGKWLIDPNDFTIAASGGDMNGATLGAALNNGSVEIQSVDGATAGYGDININDAVTWNAATKLTLNAERNININQSITAQHSNGSLALEYGQAALSAGNTARYNVNAAVNLRAGDNFSTKLGSDGTTVQYKVITALGNEYSMTGTDLQGMQGNLTRNYVLGSDIDASVTAGWSNGAGFMPVGMPGLTGFFTGNFDGLGHVIRNLTINRPSDNYIGLFGWTRGSILRNVGLVGGSITGNLSVGSLVGMLGNISVGDTSAIENAYTSSVVSGNVNIGGLAGYTEGEVRNSHATGNVTSSGGGSVGGLVGAAAGAVRSSYATGSVTATLYGSVGGLLGTSYGITDQSYASGSVTGGGTAGGLIGSAQNGRVSNSYALGSVTSPNSTGGLIGTTYSVDVINSYAVGNVRSNIYGGGLIGFIQDGNLSNVYATGSVSGFNTATMFAGGLVGFNHQGNISNSYARGNVSGSDYVGGLVGATNAGNISYSYATGKADGSNYVGGLMGRNSGSLTKSFWLAGNSSVAVGLSNGTVDTLTRALTTAEFNSAATYIAAGWNASNVAGDGTTWRIYEGLSGPLLRSYLKPIIVSSADAVKYYDGSTRANAPYSSNIGPVQLYGSFTVITNSSEVGSYSTQDGTMTVGGLYSGQQGYDFSYGDSSLTIRYGNQAIAALGGTNLLAAYNGVQENVSSDMQSSHPNAGADIVLTPVQKTSPRITLNGCGMQLPDGLVAAVCP